MSKYERSSWPLTKQRKPQGWTAVMTASDWWGLLAVPAERDGGVMVCYGAVTMCAEVTGA